MKLKLKLSVIALMILMIFAVSAVSASENITSEVTDQASDIETLSLSESINKVETTTTSQDIQDVTNDVEVTSDSQQPLNDNTEGSNYLKSKTHDDLLKTSNEDVLSDTIHVSGNSFYDVQSAINNAKNGDVVDLQGQTFTYPNSIYCDKNITIANGILDGKSELSSYSFKNCRLENLTLLNLHVTWGMSINSCNLTNVLFDNAVTDKGCTFAIRYCDSLENVNFTNCRSLMPEDPDHKDFETGVMIVTYESNYNNCNFINCSSNRHSGAICVAGKKGNFANITNCVFENCSSGVGGAVYLHGTGLSEDVHSNIINCTFTNCKASEWGGAIGTSQNYLNIENCNFTNNTAKQGAAIMVGGISHGLDGDNSQGHHDTIKNCYFFNNTGTEEGGAVHITGNYNSAINCIFDDNFAVNGKGAAIYVEGLNATVINSKFTNHQSEMGTVYIEGDNATVISSTFKNNNASHGGSGVYIEGDYSLVDASTFENNNAYQHGGAIHTVGDHARIINSHFYYNNAIPSIVEDIDYGLGGAIYIDGDYNYVGFSKFQGNTARNGSAIYTRGHEFHVEDDEFVENQAWSYFLFTDAQPPEDYWGEDLEFLINVTLVAGDNIINAIYNDGTIGDIYFHNVTYELSDTSLFNSSMRTTTDSEIHPVKGVENSNGGRILYQDPREDNQRISLNITYGDSEVFSADNLITNLYGNVLLPITKENLSDSQFHPGVYTVNADHPEDMLYTAISNSTTFTVLPHVDISVTKDSNKDVYIRGEHAVFTIKVSGVGTNATNVKVKDILPSSFTFISASATQGSYDSDENVWDVGFLPHGASQTLTLTVQTNEVGTFDNVVNVTCTEKDWNLSNNVANKTIHVDLYSTKEVSNATPSAGDSIEYYLRIFNTGDKLYNDTIQVRDKLPDGVKYAGTYTLVGADLVKFIDYGDELIWYITNIEANTRAKITVDCEVLKDGVWNNTLITPDNFEVNATINVSSNADLQIIKSASKSYVSKDDIVNWTITVINHGPSIAFGVYVKDLIPEGLVIDGHATPSNNTRYDRKTGIWTIGTLGVEDYVTLVIPTRVTVSDVHNITNVAVVNATTPDSDPSNNEDNDTVYLNPDVTIDKNVSTRNTYHGQIISWNITVTNNGPNDALNVYVIDKLPEGLRFVNSTRPSDYNPITGRWDIKTLNDGESITLTINTEVTIYDGFISNNATVYSSNDHDLDNNYDDDYTQVRTEADVGVIKIVSNKTAHYGDTVTWTIVVTNYGPNPAENVILTDFLPEGLIVQGSPAHSKGHVHVDANGNGIWEIGNLDVNQSVTCEMITIVNVTDQSIVNVVNVNATTYDPDSSNNDAENRTYVPPEADVGVVKKVDNLTPNKYDTVTWTITVVNHGPNVAKDVIVYDVLPAGLEYVSNGVPTIGSYSHNRNTWTIGDLAVETRHTLTITTRVIDTGKITNEVNVTTSTYESNLDNNYDNETIEVPAIADLAITKEVSQKESKYGDLINWTITVTNNGPNNARNVVVNDKLPSCLIYVTHNATTGLYDSALGIWQIGDLLHFDTVKLIITTRVNITNANITNVAVVTSTTPDSNETNNKANNTTVVNPSADLAIDKTVTDHGPKKGYNITWIITVTNNGPDTAVNAVATDVLPSGLIYVNSTAEMGSYNRTTNKWTIGNLTNGQSVVLNITTTVDVTKEVITNTANVTSDTPDPDLTNNEDNSTIDVGHEADLGITKVVSNSTPVYGDTINWTITVTNNGPDTAIDVFVQDELPNGLVYINSTADVGSYNPETGIWTIGDLEINNPVSLIITTLVNATGNITNVATVESETHDPTPENNTDDDNITSTAMADLAIEKRVDEYEDYVIWQIFVVNYGPNTAVDAYVKDVLPEGLIYDDFTASVGEYNVTTHIWTIGNMTKGDNAMLYLWTYLNKTSGNITNIAKVNSSTYDPNPDNNEDNATYIIKPVADLEVIKEVSNKNPRFGETITWTITVTNNGPSTAVDAYVNDTLPKGLIWQSDDSEGQYDKDSGIWTIGNLTKGQTVKLNIVTLVNITNATITNVAVVNSTTPDNNTDNNRGNNTTNVDPEADLEIIKLVSNSTAKKGDVITWTIIVTNKGPDASKEVYVKDTFPSELIFKDYTVTKGLFDSKTFTWYIKELSNGETQNLTIVATVNFTNKTIRNIVNVTSDTYDPNKTNNEANNTTDVDPVADLVIVKEVSKSDAKTGEVITWTITVTNNGPDTAVNAKVTDKIPEGLVYQSDDSNGKYDPETGIWTIGDLAKGANAVLNIKTLVNITNTTITNVANVTSDTPDDNETNNKDNNTTTVDSLADLEVVKVVSNKNPKYGETITWTITVTNNGPSAAKAVNVTDKLPNGLIYQVHTADKGIYDPSAGIWLIGDMANDDSFKLVITTIVNISKGNITNVAVVNSSTPDNNTDNNKANNTTTVDDDADLEVVKVVSNKNPKYGEAITWTITVTNNGPSDAKGVVVTDKLPAGLIFSGADGNYNPTTGIWNVGDLANGKSASLVITTVVNITNKTITNVANVTSETPDSNKTNNEANNTTDVDSLADLEIIKTVDNANPSKGDTVTWTITVINHGPDAAVNVKITDEIPEGLSLIVDGRKVNSRTLTIEEALIKAGDKKEYTFETLVEITNANITNIANVESDTPDPNETNNEDNETIKVNPEADIQVVKVVDNANPHKGDTISWTITVTNNGPDTAKDVKVTDKLPDGLVFVSASGAYSPDTGIWNVGDLAKGASQVLVIKTLVNITNANITNVAVANSTTPDPNETNNKDNNTTNVGPESDLSVVKVVSNKNPHFGETITWTITVTNNGPDKAVNVKVTDKLPDGLIFTGANGDYNRYTGVWNVGNLDNGESKSLVITTIVDITNATIRNVANVTSDTYDPNKDNNEGNNTTNVDPEADLEIIKLVSAKNTNKGDVVTWTIVVTNKGPDAALNVYAKDTLPDGVSYKAHSTTKGLFDSNTLTWFIASLAKGESATLTIDTLINVADTTLVNNVNVTNDVYDPNENNNKANNTTVVGKEKSADLEVIKTVSDANPHKGDIISWTITVTNNGPDDAKDVTVTDKLPSGLKFISADGNYNAESGVWNVGDLANGAKSTLVIKTLVDITNAKITNVVVVNSTTPDPNKDNNKGNNTTDVDPEADVKVVKTVSNPKPTVGDTITWTIVVINLGPDAAKDVVVEESLPAGLKLLKAKGSKGSYSDDIWTVGDLANGEIATLTLTTKVTKTGTIENIVVASSSTYDPNMTNNKDKEKTTPKEASADLEIIKVANKDTVKVGDKIIWTITVINHGPNKAMNVRVTDWGTGDMEFLSAKASKGTFDDEEGIWTIGDMEVGESVVLQIVCEALSETINFNHAVVESDTPDPNEDNNYDMASVEVVDSDEPAPTPDNPNNPPKNPAAPTPKMHATGNPVVMVLLALLALAGVSLRRKN